MTLKSRTCAVQDFAVFSTNCCDMKSVNLLFECSLTDQLLSTPCIGDVLEAPKNSAWKSSRIQQKKMWKRMSSVLYIFSLKNDLIWVGKIFIFINSEITQMPTCFFAIVSITTRLHLLIILMNIDQYINCYFYVFLSIFFVNRGKKIVRKFIFFLAKIQ